jgi:heat shock protein HtpX
MYQLLHNGDLRKMKRVFLFIATNIAVMLVITLLASILGVDRHYNASGLNLPKLLAFSTIVGFTGAIISLLMSKQMAKMSTGAHVIDTPQNETERWLVATVQKLANKANIGMPEVAIYEGAPNAFATGAFKNSSLVAVSTGLMTSMTKDEVEAVLAHEVAHVQNGDMVTLTLVQGVVNTFVVFLSRIIGDIVDRGVFRRDPSREGPGIGYMLTSMVCQVVFGILASIIVAYFSRAREYRADAGAAALMGQPNSMIAALRRLGGVEAGELPKSMAASGISDKTTLSSLFATHPPIEARIAALRGKA